MKFPIQPMAIAVTILLGTGTALFARNAQDFRPEGKAPGDFKVYLKAAERVRGGVDPYLASEGSPYKYSPGALVPLLALPRQDATAWVVFKLLCVASWIASILIGASFRSWRQVLLLVIGIALSWKGLLETLDYGQIEFILFFGVIAAARVFKRAPWASGLILGTLPWFKLPWGFFLFPFLILAYRSGTDALKKYSLGYAGGSLLLCAAAPFAFFGPERTIELTTSWLSVLRAQPPELYSGAMNQSIWSTIARWRAEAPISGALAAMALIAATFHLGFRLARRTTGMASWGTPLAWTAPWLIFGQLINPLSWRWASMLLVGVPFAADKTPLRSRSALVAGALLAVLLLFQQNPWVRLLGFGHWTDLHPLGLITVYWLVALAFTVALKPTPRT